MVEIRLTTEDAAEEIELTMNGTPRQLAEMFVCGMLGCATAISEELPEKAQVQFAKEIAAIAYKINPENRDEEGRLK